MRTPPLLLFATLLFWGWQSNMLLYGALAGALVELPRLIKQRWELEDVDFNRIWTFCSLAMVALAVYTFTNNDVGGGLSGMFQGAAGLRNASASSTYATTAVFRWLPLIVLPLVVAQVYNARPSVPHTALSFVLRLRRRRGETSLDGRFIDISYPYFIVCVFAAGIHTNNGGYSYFWGQAVLILWALWTLRTQRFPLKIWLGGLAAVVVLGFSGQVGINGLEHFVQNLDAALFARYFHSRTDPTQARTAIGQIGELKLSPRIVIRLEPAQTGFVPNYLREASYRLYQSGTETWHSQLSSNDIGSLLPERDNSTWIFVSNKVDIATVTIACYLNGRSRDGDPQGVLPLPSGCCQLQNLPYVSSVIALETNKNGVALATGAGLMIFDACYRPGPTMDSPPDTSTNDWDLRVPTNEVPALDQAASELSLPHHASDSEKRLAVQQFFARNFTYSSWQGPPRRSTNFVTPLTRFLVTTRAGHCEYFATATVLLLRKLGIPARYAVGYSVHEVSGSGYVIRERDAHAWCLVWNGRTKTWDDLDTTPAAWIAIEGRNASWTDTLSDIRSWLVYQFERFRWRQTDFRKYIIWSITPVMAVLLYYIIFRRNKKRRETGENAGREMDTLWPGLDSAFYQLEKSLAARGFPRQPQEPLSSWLERVLAEPSLASLRPSIRELLLLHYRYRFDPNGLTDTEKQSLVINTKTVLKLLADATLAATPK